MHVKLGANVLDKSEEHVGKVDRLVIEPGSRQILQVVAKQGFLDTKSQIIDRSMVDHVDDEGHVHLKLTKAEVENLKEYYAVNYTSPNAPIEFSWRTSLGAPLGGPLTTVSDTSVQYNSLPDNVVVITKGMDVQDRDFEKIGELDDIEFDENAAVTGFTITSGGRFRKTHHSFKVEQVAGVGQEYVRVDLASSEIPDE
jgi:uncharacterized protein YrrD